MGHRATRKQTEARTLRSVFSERFWCGFSWSAILRMLSHFADTELLHLNS